MTPCPITADRDEFRGAVTDREAALKAAGFDNEGDLQYWGNSANRAEVAVLEQAFARHRQQAEASFKAREVELVRALQAIGDARLLPSDGDPGVLRTFANEVLARAHTAADAERPDA